MADPNSFVQVNEPTTLGRKLATYAFPDGPDIVESEAVTITDSAGNEVDVATQGTLAAAAATLLSIDAKLPPASTVGEVTVIPGTNIAADFITADPTLLGFSIYNQSETDTLYLLLQPAGDASPTLFTVPIQPDTYYEVPFRYNGRVSGVWNASNPATTRALLTKYKP